MASKVFPLNKGYWGRKRKLSSVFWLRAITPTMETQIDKNMENEMETEMETQGS